MLKGSGSGLSGCVSLGVLSEPPPREWTVEGLVPKGVISVLAGHSGLGKSYLALILAICVCTGRAFLGRDVKPGPVLWIDRELDQDETTRRAYAVARGIGIDRPPQRLHYIYPSAPIGSDVAQDEVLAAVEQTGAVLCVLDSLTLGSLGDAKEQHEVVPVMRQIEQWGTTLAIDHITKRAAAGNQSSATIFGSGMKRAFARSTFHLTPAGEALTLRTDKSNFGPGSDPIHLAIEHDRDEEGGPLVLCRQLELRDPLLAGAGDHMPAHEQTLLVLIQLYEDGQTPVSRDILASERDLSVRTIQNHVTKLGARVEKHGNHTYAPACAK
ncbi:MAG: AAA family ATPase [Bacteroidota bacterium]